MAELSSPCRQSGFPLTRGSLSGGWVTCLVKDRYVTEGGASRGSCDKIQLRRARGSEHGLVKTERWRNLLAVSERSPWVRLGPSCHVTKTGGLWLCVFVKNIVFFY